MGKFTRRLFVGVAGILAAATAGAVQGPVSINGGGSDLSAFAMSISELPNCGLEFAGVVTTDAGGGTDTFTISVTDAGVVVGSEDFAFPADGAVHPIEFALHFQHLFVDNTWGLIIDDPGGLGTLEIPDAFPINTCATQSIPTLSTAGVAGFVVLLAAGGVVLLARRRRA